MISLKKIDFVKKDSRHSPRFAGYKQRFVSPPHSFGANRLCVPNSRAVRAENGVEGCDQKRLKPRYHQTSLARKEKNKKLVKTIEREREREESISNSRIKKSVFTVVFQI